MHLVFKINVEILVNMLKDRLLGNMVDLTSLTLTWAVVRAPGGTNNNWLGLHITIQRGYIRTS